MTIPLHSQGDWLVIAAVVKGATDRVRRVTVRLDGTEVDFRQALALEALQESAVFGRFSPETFNAINSLGEGERFTVDVVFRGDFKRFEYPVDEGLHTADAFEDLLREHRVEQRLRLAAIKSGVMAWIATLPDNEVEVVEYANSPMLRLTASRETLMANSLHSDLSVARIHTHEVVASPLLAYAGRGSMNDASMSGGWCWGACVGSGANVIIWEQPLFWGYPAGPNETPVAIATPNNRYWDDPATYMRAPQSCTQHSDCDESFNNRSKCTGNAGLPKYCRSEHTSYVAAAVGMYSSYAERGTTFSRAGTYNVDFYVANETDQTGLDWALGQPAVYLNHSQDYPSAATNRQLDWAARYNDILTTQACGNSGTSANVCARNWNTIGVGAYRYEVWNTQSDDRRWFDSSYINASGSPSVDGLERPHLLGPGSYRDFTGLHMPDISKTDYEMRTTTFDSGQMASTSYAAPAVLSAAIQAHTYEGWFSWLGKPIMRKAVLLAGTHDGNADGEIGKGQVWTTTPDGEDGAGIVDMILEKQILASNQYAYLQLTDASFVSCGTNCREYTVTTVTVGLQQALKVALVYNSCAPTQTSTPVLNNDFDLVVARSSSCLGGSKSSVTLNNETEMVYQKCLVFGGHLTIKVRIKNGDTLNLCGSETYEPIAIAWSKQ